jgi:hypothetical protein
LQGRKAPGLARPAGQTGNDSAYTAYLSANADKEHAMLAEVLRDNGYHEYRARLNALLEIPELASDLKSTPASPMVLPPPGW